MKARGLLVRVAGNGDAFATALQGIDATSTPERVMSTSSPATGAMGIVGSNDASTWFRIDGATSDRSAWDKAHQLVSEGGPGFGAEAGVQAVEPDWVQQWPSADKNADGSLALSAKADVCSYDPQDGSGGKAIGPGVGWPLSDAFSQLAGARATVGAAQNQILIAHLDTGYDPQHVTLPSGIDLGQQRNFIPGQPIDDAVDRVLLNGGPLTNRGHGTGTLGILAGNRLKGTSPDWPGYVDFLGGAPQAKIVPIRIADGVVEFTTSTMVKGFDYATQIGAHVLSMSMGGLSSQMLVDAINAAYDAGLVMVTAAGNSYSWLGPVTTIVFPARYRRVIAACGVMADGRAYAGLNPGTMQGNYGPPSKMDTALAAYTPNTPWAQIGCPEVVDMNGAGTSSSTPQIAAAAALWLAKHWDTVKDYAPWQRIEAVRQALFSGAGKTTAAMLADEVREKLGQGALHAQDALAIQPAAANTLKKLPPAVASWPWLDYLTGGGVSLQVDSLPAGRKTMLQLELTQMAQRVPEIDRAIADPDDPRVVTPEGRNRYLERALDLGNPSAPLRRFLETALGRKAIPKGTTFPSRPVKRQTRTPPTPQRRLRVYALDPSMGQSIDFFTLNEATLSVPWDDLPDTTNELQPGPVGEYLEVVDVDPASNRVYDPVDLNDKKLLAQDGWSPSEGNPQFHQQMTYAVAMTTIGHFERALGRKALWAPRVAADGKVGPPLRRLRIYPHAMRAQNAYYSPEKKALLFGYFAASDNSAGLVAPGSMVFTCLSSDIVAHETSHALLDGLHRRFTEASNPDVFAFHEAFADVVAIFQHFTYRDLVRFEIGRAGGDLTAPNLLSGLARQFGEGSGRNGALRDYNDKGSDNKVYADTLEPHERGTILVYAIYDAFLKVVGRKTADLIRLVSDQGANGYWVRLPPEIVERIATDTCETAAELLHICIRALDYCPAVDITFGEYLRALITADVDTRPVDPQGYRVALIEAFRKRRILPRDVRTVSEESVTWNGFVDPTDGSWLKTMLASLNLGWNLDSSREEIISINEKNRWVAWNALNKAFAATPDLMGQFGLMEDVPRYDETGHEAPSRNRRGKTTFELFSIRPARRIAEDGSFRTEIIATVQQRHPIPAYDGAPSQEFIWFRGGATIIIDPREGREAVRYSIVKNSDSKNRQQRQQAFAMGNATLPLRGLYFGGALAATEPFALMHATRESEE